jgi:hypothetical protein
VTDSSDNLVHLARRLARLESEQPYVTEEQLVGALSGLESNRAALVALLDRAAAELVLFRDSRTLHDAANTFRETRLYRVNHRHPLLAAQD